MDETPHPLLVKARERLAREAASRERIASVDDQILFKVKVQRRRGAVWVARDGTPWLVAADQREKEPPDDFCASLADRARKPSACTARSVLRR